MFAGPATRGKMGAAYVDRHHRHDDSRNQLQPTGQERVTIFTKEECVSLFFWTGSSLTTNKPASSLLFRPKKTTSKRVESALSLVCRFSTVQYTHPLPPCFPNRGKQSKAIIMTYTLTAGSPVQFSNNTLPTVTPAKPLSPRGKSEADPHASFGGAWTSHNLVKEKIESNTLSFSQTTHSHHAAEK